jgi:tetratricopeptide (TPR) repeat protein
VISVFPASGAPQPPGPAAAALLGVIVACVVVPPDVHGVGLAAAAILTAIAAAVTSARSAATPASRWIGAAGPVALFGVRAAIAPGEGIEPVAVFLVAALAGVAAAAAGVSPSSAGLVAAASAGVVALRALYETLWGLAARAGEIRAAGEQGAAAALNRLEQGRPYAGFVTPAALGCFLAMALPPTVAWALGRRGAARALGLGVAGLGAAALLATRSVTPMVALLGALALAALRRRVSPRVLAGAGVGLALGVIGAAIARPDAVFAPSAEGSPWRLRAGNVRIALEIAADHALGGVGPGGYAEAYPGYRRPGDNEARHAHDLPAQLCAEWGVPVGLMLSAAFFWLFLGPVFRKRDEGGSQVASAIAVSVAAFALHNLADFTAFLPSLLVVAAIGRGILALSSPGEIAAGGSRLAWVALAVAVAAVACGAGLSREALYDARRAALGGDHAAAAKAAARAERLAPWDPDPAQFAAEAALASSPRDAARALAHAERAVTLAPSRPSARRTRGRARAAAGDTTGAFADLAEAARLYPMQPEYARERDHLADALGKVTR